MRSFVTQMFGFVIEKVRGFLCDRIMINDRIAIATSIKYSTVECPTSHALDCLGVREHPGHGNHPLVRDPLQWPPDPAQEHVGQTEPYGELDGVR